MTSENQKMDYEMLEENVAENQEATKLYLNHVLKENVNCVISRKERGECSATVCPDPFLKECHKLGEIIAHNMLDYWENDITWLCSITKDQNIWTFNISLWEIWCSSYDFQDYLKMMFLYFWALQFRRIQVKLVIIVETAVYRKYYFNGNHWYATTNEVEESEKQFTRKLFNGIFIVEIREDPEEVFGTQFADNNLERGKLLIHSCEVYDLLDAGFTHSFISLIYAQRLNLTLENLDLLVEIT